MKCIAKCPNPAACHHGYCAAHQYSNCRCNAAPRLVPFKPSRLLHVVSFVAKMCGYHTYVHVNLYAPKEIIFTKRGYESKD